MQSPRLAWLLSSSVAPPPPSNFLLPKSGSISVHSGYWAAREAVNVAEKTVQGHGNNRGITFNDKGSGPLHLGPTDCFYTFSTIADHTKVKGYCTFGDPDGDRIFTDFKGAFQSCCDLKIASRTGAQHAYL